MGCHDAPDGDGGGGGKLSLASVGLASPGAGASGGGYKDLLVMALPKDDGLDGAKVAEAIGLRLPDVGGAMRVRRSPSPEFMRISMLLERWRGGYLCDFGWLLF